MQQLQRIRDAYEGGGRELARGVARKVVRGSGISPNLVTVLGTVLNGIAAVLAFDHQFLAAAIVFLIGSLMDAMDGAIAKVTDRVSVFGGFLDSTLDRVSEGLVLGGLGLMFAKDDNLWALGACFVALASSYLVSYTRAKAESIGVACKGGLASRVERVVLISIGLLVAHWDARGIEVIVFVLAALAALTVLQRVLHVRRELRTAPTPSV